MQIETLLPTARKRMCCIDASSSLLYAARLLGRSHDILTVCDSEGQMVGILIRSDVVRQMGACEGASCAALVTNAMTSDVTVVSANASLYSAWETMKARGLKNIPVVASNNKPLGILNARDVLESLWQEIQHEEELIFNQVMNAGYQ